MPPSKYILLLLVGISIASCNQKQAQAPRAPLTPPSEIKSSTYRINDDEHLTIIDIPDNYLGKRCWVYVNDKIKTSHMKCDDDFAKPE